MAAVVKCDGCGTCVEYKDAMHVRIYPMDSATTFKSSKCSNTGDLCTECYRKLLMLLGKGVKAC